MATTPPEGIDAIADALLADYQRGDRQHHVGAYELPARDAVARCLDLGRALLHPGYAGGGVARLSSTELRDWLRASLETLRGELRRQVYLGLHHKRQQARGTGASDCPGCAAEAETIVANFLADLPALRRMVTDDVVAAFAGDPAATGLDEILFCYPGTLAIAAYRIAHQLHGHGAVLIPRMLTEIAHGRTGIDIHPGAQIGAAFFIDHGTGVVIGETSVIGANVRIYQGVTLGALSVPRTTARPAAGARRHPTIEDDCVIYAGATILGGDTVIGKGAVIGGNAWVTASVPAGTRVPGGGGGNR